jgi:hypothetical protein
LAWEQFGSREGKKAIDKALNKAVTYYGVGKGNGVGPVIWAVEITPVMKALGLCTRQATKGRSYIMWDIASFMTRI